ncbi:hypothetical protein OCU04_003680 [Sclerotinia nivalis]|uniref:Uncharacterized protein n=1 Tax=Sclerotinia nivalis TaxID=352851 RepID=A0A9X0ATC3_9HELO|nr:hypothetical protein OCU04_003680 [Sclerotinia nivalis]
MAKSSTSSSSPPSNSPVSKTKSHTYPPSSLSSSSTHKILTTLLFPTPQKHHTIGRGTPGRGITPWMNSGDLRILGGRRGKLDQVDPESLTSFC